MNGRAIIILAAGKGTRMKSALPKVLHQAAGRSLLGHVLQAALAVGAERTVVVAGPGMADVEAEARAVLPEVHLAIQHERLGTAHAVSMAREALAGFSGTVIVLYADAPLVRPETIAALASGIRDNLPMAVLGFEAADPTGYGRLVRNPAGNVTAIREQLDASPEERAITLCNSGIIAVDSDALWRLLPQIANTNAKGEFYLTDLVELTVAEGHKVGLAVCPEQEVAGVNDRVQLAGIEREFQSRCRTRHMLNGATLVAPDTVQFSADTVLGQDVVIEPHVVFGPGVVVEDGVRILGFSHIEGARIGKGARIGPFARLRPGAVIEEDAHIGNFVEIKNAAIGKGVKANHLAYIGDARVGAGSNIGAGTITCNYDGFEKHRTEIGSDVFVGSNTALVAPVRIGDGANVAAGSVIARDVPGDALAITRAELQVREGWAAKYREIKKARKAAKARTRG